MGQNSFLGLPQATCILRKIPYRVGQVPNQSEVPPVGGSYLRYTGPVGPLRQVWYGILICIYILITYLYYYIIITLLLFIINVIVIIYYYFRIYVVYTYYYISVLISYDMLLLSILSIYYSFIIVLYQQSYGIPTVFLPLLKILFLGRKCLFPIRILFQFGKRQ